MEVTPQAKPAKAPRILFKSVEEAQRHTPFFIYEEGMGIWLSTSDARLLANAEVIFVARDAIHIPSVEKTGKALSRSLIDVFVDQARAIGLNEVRRARGYWTLSETGALQSEDVLIAFSTAQAAPSDRSRLIELAHLILRRANQDAVAWEAGGVVKHVRQS